MNDDQIIPMIDYFKDKQIEIRFIEFMDVGNDNGWDFSKVVTKDEMLNMIEEHFNIEPLEPKYFGEVAKYYRHSDNGAKFGLITSVSQSFCSTCTEHDSHQMVNFTDVYLLLWMDLTLNHS